MTSDRIRPALDRLDPEDRAIIELYMVRRLGDVEIAELLSIEVARISDRRRLAFDRLADAAEAGSPEERAELIGSLGRRPEADAPAVAEAALRERREPGRSAWTRPGRLVALALGLAAVVALVLAVSGGEEETERRADPRSPPVAPTRGAVMRPPAGGAARGFARLVRRGGRVRLALEVRGLPDPAPGRYALWLYDSVTDARRLGSFPGQRFRGRAPLPDGFERYRHLDISREPPDSIRAHSGQSVLRVPLERLSAPARRAPSAR